MRRRRIPREKDGGSRNEWTAPERNLRPTADGDRLLRFPLRPSSSSLFCFSLCNAMRVGLCSSNKKKTCFSIPLKIVLSRWLLGGTPGNRARPRTSTSPATWLIMTDKSCRPESYFSATSVVIDRKNSARFQIHFSPKTTTRVVFMAPFFADVVVVVIHFFFYIAP